MTTNKQIGQGILISILCIFLGAALSYDLPDFSQKNKYEINKTIFI